MKKFYLRSKFRVTNLTRTHDFQQTQSKENMCFHSVIFSTATSPLFLIKMQRNEKNFIYDKLRIKIKFCLFVNTSKNKKEGVLIFTIFMSFSRTLSENMTGHDQATEWTENKIKNFFAALRLNIYTMLVKLCLCASLVHWQ